jgi:hypothetical protein
MSRIRLLTLLLCLASLIACSYGFVLDGKPGDKKLSLAPSANQTHLREGSMALDSALERTFSAMGMLSEKNPRYQLRCSIISSSSERITSESIKRTDRYRLTIQVLARLSDASGKVVWQSTFTDQGAFSEGGQDEDGLDEACNRVSQQISRAIASQSL